jgi:hypothetical protein
MKQFIQKNKIMIAVIAACLLIGGTTMSFQNLPFGPIDKLDTLTDLQDTIPAQKKEEDDKFNMQDFDPLLHNLDKVILEVQKEVLSIDFDSIHRQMNASITKIDLDRIKINIAREMKEIDFSKIEQSVQVALKEINWNKMKDDVQISLQNAKKEIDKIDTDVVNMEMEKTNAEIESNWNKIKKSISM